MLALAILVISTDQGKMLKSTRFILFGFDLPEFMRLATPEDQVTTLTETEDSDTGRFSPYFFVLIHSDKLSMSISFKFQG